MTVALEMGSGFTASEWNELEKAVLIENTVTNGTVDLSKGTCALENGGIEPIKPLIYNGVWRAVVFPQSVAAGKTLLSITVDGQNYSLVKGAATTYLSGKMHKFTITVNRSESNGDFSFALKADDIVAWVERTRCIIFICQTIIAYAQRILQTNHHFTVAHIDAHMAGDGAAAGAFGVFLATYIPLMADFLAFAVDFFRVKEETE